MHKLLDFNPRRCNSASDRSGFIERNISSIFLTLPTNAETVQLFEKTLTGGFSCVNMRLEFNTEVLLPNLTQNDYNKMNIDQS